jgi:hypothetical protein
MSSLLTLLNEYGACIESEKGNIQTEIKYFIKFLINPIFFNNVKFQENSIKYFDTFYDDADFNYGQKKEFYRSRICESSVESPVFVHQISEDLMFGVDCYNERVLEQKEIDKVQENLKEILSYKFERFFSSNQYIYKDVILEPIEYEIISLKFELEIINNEINIDSVKNAFAQLLSMLNTNDYKAFEFMAPFPTSSKFMYMIQFTENTFYYDVIYNEIDPAFEFIMPRIKKLVQKFHPHEISREIKIYVAIVSYLPNCFGIFVANREFLNYKTDGFQKVKTVLDEIKSTTNNSFISYSCNDDDF